MTTETTSYACPAKQCRKPAQLAGNRIICELRHAWLATETELRCPKCRTLAHHIQVKTSIVACGCCSATWVIDQLAAADSIKAGLVVGSGACNLVMLAVDVAVAEVLSAGARAATENGDTSLSEIVARFRRGLIAAGVPKR